MKRRELLGTAVAATGSGFLASAAVASGHAGAANSGGTMTLRKGYLDGPFGQIHYYEQGTGPCLIMLHQSPVSARMFERAMPHLAALGLRAVAIDTPGFGNSDVPAEPPSIAEYADAIPAVIKGLGLTRAHVLGHHTGASIACNFAVRYPEMVDALVLNGTAIFTPEELEQFADVPLGPQPKSADGSHLLKAWNTRLHYSPGWTDVDAMHRRLVDQLWAGDTSWYGHKAAFEYEMLPDLMAVQTRTLILTNTGDDIHHLSQAAYAARPDFAYAELEGGTHDIVDEQPEAWSRAVASFVLG